MRAKQLVDLLQKMVDAHGDFDVVAGNDKTVERLDVQLEAEGPPYCRIVAEGDSIYG